MLLKVRWVQRDGDRVALHARVKFKFKIDGLTEVNHSLDGCGSDHNLLPVKEPVVVERLSQSGQ